MISPQRILFVSALSVGIGLSAVALVPQAAATDTKIYIDSVPRGATVNLLPKENEKGDRVKLGKTPLIVDSSTTPTMRFLIMMKMEDFLKQVELVPELKDWVKRFKSDQYFSSGHHSGQSYFNFDTPESEIVESGNGALVAVGPIYDLSSRKESSRASIRICALFIPRGVRREAFFQLMPKPGTFPPLLGTWPDDLRSEYHLSDAQANTALESLSRSGKYVVTVKDPFIEGSGKLISFTEMLDGSVMIDTVGIRLIPNYNDQP